MAKGNMILGYLRGAIGDIVFWRAKGQQMARARNRAPANPRTELQIDVRARWAMLSKFVSIMEPRFLRGAFEGKKVSESDYNVFMRENYSRAQMLSKTASQNFAYPAPGGAWIMSKGSLPVVQQYEEIDDVQLYFPFFQLCTSNSAITLPPASGQTIAWLSNVLLSVAPDVWRVGDIITFVVVSYDLSQDDGEPVAVPLGTDYNSKFIYRQIVVNSSDNTLLSDALGGYFHANVYSNGTMFGLSYGSDDTDAPAEWAAQSRAVTVIHSRNTISGTKVSSSVLLGNSNYALNNSFMFSSDAYKSAVYADWQAAETAILQGLSVSPVTFMLLQWGNTIINEHPSWLLNPAGTVGHTYSMYVIISGTLPADLKDVTRALITHIKSYDGMTIDEDAEPVPEMYGMYKITLNTLTAQNANITWYEPNGNERTILYS